MVKTGWSRVWAIALVLAALAMVPVVFGWERMPDPFASHWGLGGVPNGHMPLWALPLLPIGLIALGLAIGAALRSESRPSAEGLALLGVLGILGVVLTTSTVLLNLDAPSWDQAAPMPWTHIVSALVLPVLGGVVFYRFGRRWFPMRVQDDSSSVSALEVGDNETVAWTGACQVRYPFVIAGFAALLMVFLPSPYRWLPLPFVLVAMVLSHVRVMVNDSGLKARLGGVITRRIGLEEMRSVNVIDLEPNEWGGWGYRMAPGRTAIVIRRGPAIEVALESGRRFAVTVDDATTGAGVLAGLLNRHNRQHA